MNFFIISDNDAFTKELSGKIKKQEKSAKIYKSDFDQENLKKNKKHVDTTSLCILYSDKKNKSALNIENILILSLFSGFCIAKEIPLITNIPQLHEQKLFSQAAVRFIDSKEKIYDYIEKKYKELIKATGQRFAKNTLLSKGIPFTSDCFALYIARNKPQIIDLFLGAGIDINSRDDLGTPMLNVAVRNDNEALVKRFVELGADINTVSKDRGYTPVMDAVWKGNKAITKYLIEKGADLNTISKEGQSNLVLAVGSEKYEIVEMLAKNGADPDIKDMMGMSAYGYATLFRKEGMIEILKPYHKE